MIEIDPIEDDKLNEYRIDRNNPIDNTDLTGLEKGWLPDGGAYHQQYLRELGAKIREWRAEGWDLPVALLNLFLSRQHNGSATDDFNLDAYAKKYKSHFYQNEREYLEDLAQQLAATGKKSKQLTPELDMYIGRFGKWWTWAAQWDTKYYTIDPEMFNAYAKYWSHHTGELTITSSCDKVSGRLGTIETVHWTYKGTITIKDEYVFPADGLWENATRMPFPAYEAGHRLEYDLDYRTFHTTMRWDDTLSGTFTRGLA